MSLDLQQDHQEISWGYWLAQFVGKPKLESLVKALLKPGAMLQEALYELFNDRWLHSAEGAQLDGIGEIVGLPREIAGVGVIVFFGFESQPNIDTFGKARIRRIYEDPSAGTGQLDDESYRKMLYWKIAINNGHGTAPEIIASLKAIFGATAVIVQDMGNAKIRIWIGTLPVPGDPIMANVRRWIPKAAGVGLQVITGSTAKPFGFISQGFYGFGVGVMARGI
jgi:hypothetical protein